MKLGLILALAGATLAAGAAYPATNPPPAHTPLTQTAPKGPPYQTAAGFWAQVGDDGDVGAWFYFTEKNGKYEGRMVKMFRKAGVEAINVDTCSKCEGDQKDAPMLGLTMIRGMVRDGVKYEEGSILDPRDGTVYHALMELSPDGKKLSVRGYLGIPMLGQTQDWARLPDDTMAPADIPKDSYGPAGPAHASQ